MILLNADQVNFFVPRICVADARKYIPEILEGRGIDSSSAVDLLDEIVRQMQILEDEWLEDFSEIAQERMQSRDPDQRETLAVLRRTLVRG